MGGGGEGGAGTEVVLRMSTRRAANMLASNSSLTSPSEGSEAAPVAVAVAALEAVVEEEEADGPTDVVTEVAVEAGTAVEELEGVSAL